MQEILRLTPLVVVALFSLILGVYTFKRSVPVGFAVGAFIAAFLFQSFVSGFVVAVVAAGVAVGVFIALFFVNVLNRTTTFMVPVLLALVPISLWWVFLPGVAIAAIFSLVFVIRALGVKEVKAMAVETSSTVQFDGPASLPGLVHEHAKGTLKVKSVNVFLCLAAGFVLSLAALLFLR